MESKTRDALAATTPSKTSSWIRRAFFSPPDPQNHFMVQSLDVNITFFNFQRSILNNKWKLTLEDHMHSAMAVHSILFLSPDQHNYEDISPFFNQTMYAAIIQTIEGMYRFKKPRFPMNTITNILNTFKKFRQKPSVAIKASYNFLDLISQYKKSGWSKLSSSWW